MKKIFFTLLCGMAGLFPVYLSAQCSFANPSVRLISPPVSAPDGKCSITLELSFDIMHNNGGKYFWIHFWPTSAYPDYSYASSKPPVTSAVPGGNGALDASIATLGFYHMNEALQVQSSYPPDNNAPGFQSAYTITEIENGGILPGSDRYTVSGITVLLPQACNQPQSITADLWESQAAHAQQVACFTKGVVFFVNDPLVNGFLYCDVPREYAFTIRTISTSGDLTVNYEVLIDNGDGIYNRSTDTMKVNNGSVILNSANNFRFASGRLGFLPYSGQKPYADQSLWVTINSPAIPNEIYALLYNSCILLPAGIQTFTAARNGNMAGLRWTTVTETNNRGFFIEKINSSGEWVRTGFVASLAAQGNSFSPMEYQYAEVNNNSIPTLYRLAQTDLNGNVTYSMVRTVKGLTESGSLLIYPNPSADGQITVLVQTVNPPYKISVYDLQGKRLREQVINVQQPLCLSDFKSGMYTLVLTKPGSSIVVTERFVINK